MAAAVESNDLWRRESPDLVPIGGESEGDYNVCIRELIPSLDSTYEVLELLGKFARIALLMHGHFESNDYCTEQFVAGVRVACGSLDILFLM